MKKLILLCVMAFAGIVSAQVANVGTPTAKGNWMFGADFGLSFASNNSELEYDGNAVDDSETTVSTFSIKPNASYFVMDNLAVGLGLGYTSTKTEFGDDENTESTFTVIPNAKYFFGETNVKPYLGVGVGYMSSSVDDGSDDLTFGGLAVNAKGGVSYFFNPNVAGSLGLDYIYSSMSSDDVDDVDVIGNTFGISAGFSFFL